MTWHVVCVCVCVPMRACVCVCVRLSGLSTEVINVRCQLEASGSCTIIQKCVVEKQGIEKKTRLVCVCVCVGGV